MDVSDNRGRHNHLTGEHDARPFGFLASMDDRSAFRAQLLRSAPSVPHALLAVPLLVTGCDSTSSNGGGEFTTNNCTIPTSQPVSGYQGGADCIPSIDGVTTDDRRLVDGTPDGLNDDERVIGLRIGSQSLAIPLPILWTHEVVNIDDWGGRTFAATYCPLTGSSLVFDRSVINGAELGVSGLLFNNNLVMYDRRDEESLWPQMSRRSTCGADPNRSLSMLPLVEMNWGRWRELHPDTKILTDGNSFERTYPYGGYRAPDTNPLFSMPVSVASKRPLVDHRLRWKLPIAQTRRTKGFVLLKRGQSPLDVAWTQDGAFPSHG